MASESMIKKAGLALLNARCMRLDVPLDAMSIEEARERLPHAFNDACKDVRAVAESFREPTEAMQRAGFKNNRHVNENPCDRPTCIGAVTMPADKAWRAMIDAILSESPTPGDGR